MKVRGPLGLSGNNLKNTSIYLPCYCPIFWECAEVDGDGNANKLQDQKITMKDVEDMKRDSDLPVTIREQLAVNNDTRYMRLRLVNDYQQLQEWLVSFTQQTSSSDTVQIRKDYDHHGVASRNPQYAMEIASALNKHVLDEKQSIDWESQENKTLAQLIKENPQIEMDLAGIGSKTQ